MIKYLPTRPPALLQRWIFVFLVVAVIVYANSLAVPAQFDDAHVFAELTTAQVFAKVWPLRTRSVSELSFALNHALHGNDVYGYHAVNILVHFAAAVALAALLLLLLPDSPTLPFWSPWRQLAAALPALLFLVHPLNTQAVTYICQRYTSLAACFYVWALVAYVLARRLDAAPQRYRRRARLGVHALGITAAILAMLSKEFTVSLPAVLLMLEFGICRRRHHAAGTAGAAGPEGAAGTTPPRSRWQWLLPLLPYLAVGAIVPLQHLTALPGAPTALGEVIPRWAPEQVTRLAYFATQLKVIVLIYLRLAIVPLGLSIEHSLALATTLWQPAVLACATVLTLLAATAGVLLYRGRVPLSGAGILWLLLTLAPTSSLITNNVFIAEHRMYLPLMGLALPLAEMLAALGCRRRRRIAATCAISIIVAFGGLTIRQNRLWQDPVRLWSNAVRIAPDSSFAYLSLAQAYRREGRHQHEYDASRKALAIDPGNINACNHLGNAALALGRVDEAFEHYQQTVRLDPEHARAWANLGMIFNSRDQHAQAEAALTRALTLQPALPEAYYQRGILAEKRHDQAAAAAAYTQALQFNARLHPARYRLGEVYLAMGERQQAAQTFQQLLAADPGHVDATMALAELAWQAGYVPMARQLLQQLAPQSLSERQRHHWQLLNTAFAGKPEQ